MSSNNAIRRGIRQALFAGAVATAAGYTPLAGAQDAGEEAIEEIVTTGSRIVRRDFQSASPIATVDAEYFEQVASITVESVLNTLPQFVPSITSSSNNPSNGGQANVELRGLGTPRTLVLIDGRRVIPSNGTGVVDLNIIPTSLVQSVEVITGGASAVYGSDAVAGVVNFKLKDFQGLEVKGGWGQTAESDGAQKNISVAGRPRPRYGGRLLGGPRSSVPRRSRVLGCGTRLRLNGDAVQPVRFGHDPAGPIRYDHVEPAKPGGDRQRVCYLRHRCR
jgi:outer membrane receptor protein involved in Fe transport